MPPSADRLRVAIRSAMSSAAWVVAGQDHDGSDLDTFAGDIATSVVAEFDDHGAPTAVRVSVATAGGTSAESLPESALPTVIQWQNAVSWVGVTRVRIGYSGSLGALLDTNDFPADAWPLDMTATGTVQELPLLLTTTWRSGGGPVVVTITGASTGSAVARVGYDLA